MTDFAKKVKKAIIQIQYDYENEHGESIILSKVLEMVGLSVTPYYKLIKHGLISRAITEKKFEELIIISGKVNKNH